MTINCNGKLLALDTPKIMGIINLTPDSFYASSRFDVSSALSRAEIMLDQGVDIIDLGAMSSRPGAEVISTKQELEKLLPTLQAIMDKYPDSIVSIDTLHSEAARKCIAMGASLINDILAGTFDPLMMEVVAQKPIPYIMMHKKGMPIDMQDAPMYDDVVMEIMKYFAERIHLAQAFGIKDLILDVGFGFGKTIHHNYTLLKHLPSFAIFDRPILAGISRKSMIYKLLNTNANDALNGSTAANMVALLHGAKILRVHDVKEAKECIQIYHQLSIS